MFVHYSAGFTTGPQFVARFTALLVGACDGEAQLAFASQAGHDGDASSISSADVNVWFDSFGEGIHIYKSWFIYYFHLTTTVSCIQTVSNWF